MTVLSATSRITYPGNGSTTSFPVAFPFHALDDVVVEERVILTGVSVLLTRGLHYNIIGTANALGFYPDGGSVEAVTAPASTVQWVVYRNPSITQTLDLQDLGNFPAESVEARLDKLTMISQRLYDLVIRSVRAPDADTFVSAIMNPLPSSVDRASKFLAFSATGHPIAAAGTSANLGPVSSYINTLLDDADAPAARATLGIAAYRRGTTDLVVTPAQLQLGSWAHGTTTYTLQTEMVEGSLVTSTTNNGHIISANHKFSEVIYNIVDPASPTTIVNEYWNGSTWATLTLTATPNFSTFGLTRMRFAAPGDWQIGGSGTGTPSSLYNIRIRQTSGTAVVAGRPWHGHRYTITASDAVIPHPSGGSNFPAIHENINVTVDTTLAGSVAGGRDQAGAFSAGQTWKLYLISNGTTVAGLISVSSTPTLPSGYTHYLQVGGSKFVAANSASGVDWYYSRGGAVILGSSNEIANALTSGTSPNDITKVNLTFTPSIAVEASLRCSLTTGASTNVEARVWAHPQTGPLVALAYSSGGSIDIDPTAEIKVPLMIPSTVYYGIFGGSSPALTITESGFKLPSYLS